MAMATSVIKTRKPMRDKLSEISKRASLERERKDRKDRQGSIRIEDLRILRVALETQVRGLAAFASNIESAKRCKT
jgi:hypothetical protein